MACVEAVLEAIINDNCHTTICVQVAGSPADCLQRCPGAQDSCTQCSLQLGVYQCLACRAGYVLVRGCGGCGGCGGCVLSMRP